MPTLASTEPLVNGPGLSQGPPDAPGAPILSTTRRPWWQRRWGITAIVIGVLFVFGSVSNAMKAGQTGSSASPNPLAAVIVITSPTPPVSFAQTTATTTEIAAATPEATADVTPEPIVAPEPEVTSEPVVTPPPSILKTTGRGDKIVKLAAQDAPTFARITGKGSGNFAVISYVGSDYDDLLVNEIGSYAGFVYIAAGVNRSKITSAGTWTIEVRPITSARAWDGVSALTGKGDSVAILTGGANGITAIRNKSRSNFAVIAYSPEGEYLDLLVNEIGTYSGEVLLPEADPIVLAINAVGGTWSFSEVGQ
jgi:hypothetical protein